MWEMVKVDSPFAGTGVPSPMWYGEHSGSSFEIQDGALISKGRTSNSKLRQL